MQFEFTFATVIIILTGIFIFSIPLIASTEFTNLQLLSLFLHNLGFVFGTGGAIVVNAFNILLERNEQLKPFKLSIVSIPFKFVWVGLVLMLIVHTGELISEASLEHFVKVLAVYPILIGLIYIRFSLIPKIKIHMPKAGEKPSKEFLSAKNQMRILPLILLAFWLLDFILNTVFEPKEAFDFLLR